MKALIKVSVAMVLIALLISSVPTAYAGIPNLQPPSGNLPSVTYYVSTTQHYTISPGQWQGVFTNVFDNKSYVSYNWTSNLTQYLILFDLSYSGLNPYGLQFIKALSTLGFPSVANLTKAFNMTKNDPSQIGGYSNIQALDAGAYPGFSWSVPHTTNLNKTYMYFGIIGGIVASMVVLYYVFNRKK